MAKAKREKVRGKHKRMARIVELSEALFSEQMNEDTAAIDVSDLIELVCLMADQLKEISGKED